MTVVFVDIAKKAMYDALLGRFTDLQGIQRLLGGRSQMRRPGNRCLQVAETYEMQ